MSYTPINWQTGQTITADKLNKMDNGWGFQSTQLFSETVTTVASGGMYAGILEYSNRVDSETITATFNGTEYTCPRIDAFGSFFYGGFSQSGPDFSVYPFAIQSSQSGSNQLYTETAGTYTLTVAVEGIAISDTFSSAVGKSIVVPTFEEDLGSGDFTCDMTWPELNTAVTEGRCFFAKVRNVIYNIFSYNGTSVISFKTISIEADVTEEIIYYYSDGSIETEENHYPSN